MKQAVEINGYKVFPFYNRQAFLSYLENGNWNKILIALNAEKLMCEDQELRDLVNSNIGYPDGIGAVWALQKANRKSVKIPGVEFWIDIIEEFQKEKSFYLIGGKPEIIEKTIGKLRNQFLDLQLKGYNDGYFDEAAYEEIKEDIFKKKPDVVFVAMGSPRQEFIMNDLQKKHNALYMGLGGSFDVYVGAVERAPRAWVDLNLEWAYRLIKQPKRIFRQWVYLKFMYRLFLNKL